MPVKLWTGLPGAGKTAAMVAAILEFKRTEPDRPVFAININGLDPSVAEPLTFDQLRKWWELPPGSLICIDEGQEDDFFPLDRGQPADWVKRISKVRHEGMDFWITTQHPTLMSGYVRRLVDQHVHCVRKFNSNVVRRYAWGRCMDSCEKGSAQRSAVASWGQLPAEVFDLYKSSNAHTMKRRIPARAFIFPACALVVLAAAVAIPLAFKHLHRTAQQGVSSVGDKPAAKEVDVSHVDASMRQSDYAKWTRPRVDGVPWSAPMFDGLSVQAVPRVYCVAVDDGRCSCMTEQGTRFAMKPAMCREIAANGLYNPFQGDQLRDGDRRQAATPGEPQARPAAPAGDRASASSVSWASGVGSQSYVPPASAGSWNPDALAK